jgi:hypothetical protein
MGHGWVRFSVVAVLSLPLCSPAQQAPVRDGQAVQVLGRSLVAMGHLVPSDSTATGTVVVVAGSTTDSGTIRVLTRGLNQSAEQIQTPVWTRAVRYSQGLASEADGTSTTFLQQELVVTSQCVEFPLQLVAAALNDPDISFQYVGMESLDGSPAQRVRFSNTFSSRPRLQRVSEFSVKDIWIDAISALPRKLSFNRRAASGPVPAIPVEVYFSDYRNAGGVLYPFSITKLMNGSPHTTIIIENVAFNTGLTDADFEVQ